MEKICRLHAFTTTALKPRVGSFIEMWTKKIDNVDGKVIFSLISKPCQVFWVEEE